MITSIDRIKKLCEENGTNVTSLCKQITGSSGNLSTWNKGNIRNDYLVKIADYFNVSTDYLLGKTDVKTKPDDNDITFDDFSFAMYNETKELSEEQKNDLLEMARIFKKHLKEKNKE